MLDLRPMDPQQYERFIARAIPGFAAEKVAVGEWPPDEADARAAREFGRILPQGLATPGHHLFAITDASAGAVGEVWIMENGQGAAGTAFVYDLHIDPAHRRRGFARAAMQALERKARELGASQLALHVFGHNDAAVALYRDLGYRVTDLHMAKPL